MTEVATWLIANFEKIGGYVILLALTLAWATGNIWSKIQVNTMRADFEKREAKTISDCEYHRQAHERLLGELERAQTVSKVLASKAV